MSKILLLALLMLTFTPALPGHAAPPAAAQKPVLPLVQKFVDTIQNAQTLSVDAVQVVPPGSIGESAHLTLARPNQMKLTARIGAQPVGTVVSDGKAIYCWDSRQYVRQDAPKSLALYDPPLPMGYAASMAGAIFANAAQFLPSLQAKDKGPVTLHGIAARKMVSQSGQGTTTLWLAPSNGLPLQMTVDTPARTITLAFKNYQLGKPVAANAFAARPPKNLTAYAPPSQPAEPALLPVGSPAPDFTLPSPTGKPVTLSGLKGQVVLIDFWATWCGPCMMAMPHIQALHKELGGKGLKVLSVNTSDTRPAMTKFLKTHKEYTTTMLFDGASPSVSSAKYKVSGIPTVYLIDKDGNVAASFVGYDPDGETAIKAALAKLGVD